MALRQLGFKIVFCNTRFIGFHRWPDAPDSVGYLRSLHRHEFHVKVSVIITHDNRHVEFITLKQDVDNFLEVTDFPEASSCEMMCDRIAEHLDSLGYNVNEVEVSEDGENGAHSFYDRMDSDQVDASGSDKDSESSASETGHPIQ